MRTSEQILEIIKDNFRAKPSELGKTLGISQQAVHRQLKRLVDQGKIIKLGSPPKVFYELAKIQKKLPPIDFSQLKKETAKVIEDNFCYFSPQGKYQQGVEAFSSWLRSTKQEKRAVDLAKEYSSLLAELSKFYTKENWIQAVEKIQNTFEECFLDELIYQDFYSLPKFGKTKLGHFVLHAKQSQNIALIKDLSAQIEETLLRYIGKKRIQAIAWMPHSIPRKVQLLKELRNSLSFPYPEILLSKSYSGRIPIAQKSLSKLEERIENARNTIFLNSTNISYKRVLLIDDAVGSGATLNEVAKKLREQTKIKEIYAYAIVGSYKGFEVIKEV